MFLVFVFDENDLCIVETVNIYQHRPVHDLKKTSKRRLFKVLRRQVAAMSTNYE